MTLNTSAAVAWWRQLTDEEHGDRGARARLRRCGTIAEAMTEQETILLFQRVGGRSPADLPSVALVAAVLSHVRDDDPSRSIARSIGPNSVDAPEPGKLSPARFRWLVQAATGDERLTAFRRLAAICDGTVNVRDCVDALIDWTEQRKTRWVYDYWNANALPTNNSTKEVVT